MVFAYGEVQMQFTTTKERVRVLRQADAPAIVSVLTRAFDQEPAKLTMLPDSGIRRTVLEMSVKARLYDTLRYGSVHGASIDGELGAIALWYPPGVAKLSGTGAARAVWTWLGSIPTLVRAFPHIARVLSSDLHGALDLAKKRGSAVAKASSGITWQLELLGTLPERRRKGLARALLERQLQRCDQDGAAAWLEATDPINPPIYERFGFETIAHIDGPTWMPGYWVMRREPQADGD
jgi:GNAT superfamily N-acetyltransferase